MKYPIGIQTFSEIRNGGYAYVDKTALIFRLVERGKYYFLSRPRRFGKSLLISTLEAYFKGEREVFRGLAVDKLEKNWTAYPVLHIDLNARKYDCAEALESELSKHLELWEALYGSQYRTRALEERFYHIIRLAYEKTGRQVVVLVDEYDKPMLQAIENKTLGENYRATLKAFYSVLKTQDRYIKFAFLTGVTKFGKVSVFSDLKNLKDISVDPHWAELCGITEAEIHTYLKEGVRELAEAVGLTFEECLTQLRRTYDGYRFCEHSVGLYNPFSLLNAFDSCAFKDYWFETGTPTFLVELLKRNRYDLNNLNSEMLTVDELNAVDSVDTTPIPVIYQSGYLTIKDYDPEFKTYSLDFPNEEVERGFNRFLAPFYVPQGGRKTEFEINRFVQEVRRGEVESFLQRLVAFFADGNYEVMGEMELYFQNVMYVIFKLMGFFVEVEKRTARGRVDIVLKTADFIYVIEIKRDGSAREALEQIETRGYATPYAADPRRLFRIGINFSSEKKTVDDYLIS